MGQCNTQNILPAWGNIETLSQRKMKNQAAWKHNHYWQFVSSSKFLLNLCHQLCQPPLWLSCATGLLGFFRHKSSRIQRANVPHCSNRNSYEAQQRLVRRIEWGEMPLFDVWKWMIWGSSQTMMQSMSIWAIKAISLWVYGVSGCWEQFAQLLHGCVLDYEKISKIHDKKDYILEFSHHHC